METRKTSMSEKKLSDILTIASPSITESNNQPNSFGLALKMLKE